MFTPASCICCATSRWMGSQLITWMSFGTKCMAYYRARKIGDHFMHMKLSLFCKPRTPHAYFPKMRGKAIQVRNLGPPLLAVWSARMDAASVLHQQVAFVLRASVKLEDMVNEHSNLFRYPPANAAEFMQTTDQYLQMVSLAARTFNEEGRRLFDVTTKFHILWHCADSASKLNPCKSWCYMGEDFMQHGRKLAASSLPGTKAWVVGSNGLHKWVRGFTLRFLPRRAWFSKSD